MLVVAVIWLIMEVPILYESIGVRMEGLIQNITGEGGDSSSAIRKTLRQLAIEQWWKRIFFGYGFDSFKYLAQEELGRFYYSHCNYTELLYSGGIFYLLFYYSFYAFVLWRSFRQKQLQIPYKAFAVGIVLCFLIFEYGAVMYNGTPTMICLAMASSVTFFKTHEQKTKGDSCHE